MTTIKLSILVPTVPSRINYFYPRIMNELIKQTSKYTQIEVLSLFDNKKRSVGAKRQTLMDISRGEYIVFIDDDDRISSDYIDSIMNCLEKNKNVDCVVFNTICCINSSSKQILCKYGVEFNYGYINKNKTQWRGKPAHTMVWKASIAKKHKYNNANVGEDMNWVKKAYPDIANQVRINKVLYYYDANPKTTSETRRGGLSDNVIKKNIKKISKGKLGDSFYPAITGGHSKVISTIVRLANCKRYLELGVYVGETIDLVAPHVPHIFAVDIVDKRRNKNIGKFFKMTTDKFFEQNRDKFDAIFIDADHSFESVKKDFENALLILNRTGFIFLHDTDPVMKKYLQPGYCNDCYKIVEYIYLEHPELNIVTLPLTEAGLSIITRKGESRVSTFLE